MRHLIIKDIGPIKLADIELKRFNVFIGHQSSGKSTIAKVISTCNWIEKEVATTLDVNAVGDGEAFRSLMENFHKMDGYFSDSSKIHFESDFVTIDYASGQLNIGLKQDEDYYRQKICYIPAERNMVTLPELQGFEFGATNLRSFLFDWFNAREFYNDENKTDILGLDVKYFYDKEQKRFKDRIEHINGQTYGIPLSSASSGLQSIIPLLVMLQYYSGQYFTVASQKKSFDRDAKAIKMVPALAERYILKPYKPNHTQSENDELLFDLSVKFQTGDEESRRLLSNFQQALNRLLTPVKTTFIIEEPEQNLFPDTQLELTERLTQLCQQERKHEFTLTTHSPYIINYFNILINQDKENRGRISVNDLNVFAVGNGGIQNLKSRNEKGEWLIDTFDLTEQMQSIYSEYVSLKKGL